MSNIIEKLGIFSPGYYREFGDNITRRGQKFSDIKHHYSLDEMVVIASAPEMLEALIEDIQMYEFSPGDMHSNSDYVRNKSIVKKATGKTWEEIKQLID